RVYVATAQGQIDPPSTPQQPTVHALDMDTGAVLWQKGSLADPIDASFGPVSATKELVFVGRIVSSTLPVFDAKTCDPLLSRLLGDVIFGSAIASGAVAIDGTLLVGTGIGTLTGDPTDQSTQVANFDSSLVALCVPQSKSCPK